MKKARWTPFYFNGNKAGGLVQSEKEWRKCILRPYTKSGRVKARALLASRRRKEDFPGPGGGAHPMFDCEVDFDAPLGESSTETLAAFAKKHGMKLD